MSIFNINYSCIVSRFFGSVLFYHFLFYINYCFRILYSLLFSYSLLIIRYLHSCLAPVAISITIHTHMFRFSLRVILIVGLSAAIMGATGESVVAQTSSATTFQITPALQELKVDPGYTGSFAVTLVNKSAETVPFKVYSRNFMAQGIDGQITFGDDDSSSYAAGDWLVPSTTDVVVGANEEQKIEVVVSVPANAEPGGHYASILFEQVLPASQMGKNSQVQVATRMAAMVYFTISGEIVEAGQILGATPGDNCTGLVCGFSTESFFDHGPVPFSFIFTNTGNVHVRPKGTITIYQYGREIAKINVEDRAVLPNSQRKFTAEWDKQLLIGPYEAKLHLVYGSNNYTIDAATSFWAFPWQIALGVVIVILIVGAIFLSRKYHRVKRLAGGRG
jgi:hypothetical protein